MSNLNQTQQQTEIKKSPFEQTFLCPKCSEILFTKICYYENTNTPQVEYNCPQKHSGMVDLSLFFDLFYSSNEEIENELSKFEEELEKDIEIYKNKKIKEKKSEEDKLKENEKKNEINLKLFKELQKCNVIDFTLLNRKNEINTNKKNKEKKINNRKLNNNLNIIKKSSYIEKDEKEDKLKEEKFLCEKHNKNYFSYCLSCKKNICRKCAKSKKHHKNKKIFNNMKMGEKDFMEFKKFVGECEENLNKFENNCNSLIKCLSNNEEKEEKTTLYILSKAFININREYLNEVQSIIKNYNNCLKNKKFNYEIIMSIKDIKKKTQNKIFVPNKIQELINIIKDYKDYLFENTNYSENHNDNKYLLFDKFNEILKSNSTKNEKDIFKSIIEDQTIRNLINLDDNINDEINLKGSINEIHEVKKYQSEEDDYLEEEEEEGEEEMEEDYDEDINNEEDENNLGDDEDEYKEDDENQ